MPLHPLLLAAALAGAPPPVQPGGPASMQEVRLEGTAPIAMDYLAYDAAGDRVWVPAGPTGRVDVIDAKTSRVTPVEGFVTAELTSRDGKVRTIGPSAVTIGVTHAFVGDRAGSLLCAVDLKTLAKVDCLTLPSTPDGVAWVAATHEVWVTTPRDGSLTIVDARDPAALKVAGRIALPHPEGYAVDQGRALFYTNQEEEDRTVAIDVKARAVVATWAPGCGKEGPRGLAVDPATRHLLVACTTSLVMLDAGKDGAALGRLEVGAGVDNLDWLPSLGLAYAAAGRAGTLTAVGVDKAGALSSRWSAPSSEGTRVVVMDARGGAWVADSKGGRVLVFR